MKVKIEYTTSVTDDYRRAIRLYYGLTGLASRDEVKDFIQSHGESLDVEIMADLEAWEEEQAREVAEEWGWIPGDEPKE